MGNRGSVERDTAPAAAGGGAAAAAEVPHIAVIEASPLPAEVDMFSLPGPAPTGPAARARAAAAAAPGLSPAVGAEPHAAKGAEQSHGGSFRPRSRSGGSEGDGEDADSQSQSSSSSSEGGGTPRDSRKHFLEVMMNSSPQVRRSLVLRSSSHRSSRSESDSASLSSCTLDEERASVTLDPLEHEWMLCASDGEWSSLQRLLAAEPSLLLRRDFVTGFSCLHWAAKLGRPELIALMVNFAKQHHLPLSVDVRSHCGYTPLHVAAMHRHAEVLKLLVGAYDADVELRDHSGRKAAHYLGPHAAQDLRDILGQGEEEPQRRPERGGGGGGEEGEEQGPGWRLSKVLRPPRFLSPGDWEPGDGGGGGVVRRKSSLSGVRPRLQQLRVRTSQLVHSVSFRDGEGLQDTRRHSFRTRPRSFFFGKEEQ